jgi:inner membrane protein YidH
VDGNAPLRSEPRNAAEDVVTWRAKVLYHHRTRSDLTNERKYLGWLKVSLALITLGFVVERLDLFLRRALGVSAPAPSPLIGWAPWLIYAMGGITIAVATWEFFSDRRKIAKETPRGSRLLVALILLILVSVLLVAVLLWMPTVRLGGPAP